MSLLVLQCFVYFPQDGVSSLMLGSVMAAPIVLVIVYLSLGGPSSWLVFATLLLRKDLWMFVYKVIWTCIVECPLHLV